MEQDALRQLLRRVRRGEVSVEQALESLRLDAFRRLPFATLDMERALRRGFPEVVLGEAKTAEQLLEIAETFRDAGQTLLITRLDRAKAEVLRERFPKFEYHETARLGALRRGRSRRLRPGIVVVTGGTGDIAVAEEAAVTAEIMGQGCERVYDVGVAGLGRLTAHRERLVRARVVVVAAGMEGALPSVVAGLTDCPVIGVPTSVGSQGLGAGGEAALMAMLNSCASGVVVVNIDQGFRAGYAAALINRMPAPSKRAT